jgi:hypothetical protein
MLNYQKLGNQTVISSSNITVSLGNVPTEVVIISEDKAEEIQIKPSNFSVKEGELIDKTAEK